MRVSHALRLINFLFFLPHECPMSAKRRALQCSEAMVYFGLYLRPISSSVSPCLRPPSLSSSRNWFSSSSSKFFYPPLQIPNRVNKIKLRGRVDRGICRADFSHDAPLAAAVGACILSSFILPVAERDDEEDEDSAITSTDTRIAAMAVISFIPYFNWLSWVFAWLDTGKRRYAVYSLVYLAPYVSSNLSISPNESWLPISSIVLGIIHVQLEASIRNGDLQTFQFFSNAALRFSSESRKKETFYDRNHENYEEPFDEIPRWRAPERHEHGDDDRSENEGH